MCSHTYLVQSSYELDSIIVSILQRRKLRLKERERVSDLSKATKLGNGRQGFEPQSAIPMYLPLAGAFL